MAVVSGTVHSVNTVEGLAGSVGSLQVAQILFTVSGTYAQADNGILTGVAALISASRHNGKTVTLVDCMGGIEATKGTDPSVYMYCKGAAVSSADITFEITLSSFTTEYTDATAVVAQGRPFSLLVAFTES